MKRIIAFFIAVVMVVLVMPTGVSAETEGYYTYEVNNGKSTITKVDKSISGDVVIPDKLGGYPVKSIGNQAFSKCINLTSVSIPDSVTSIENWAFYGCTALMNIAIPDSVTFIGGYVFQNCESLISVAIPNGITSIGNQVFYHCHSLKSVTIPDSVTSIGVYAFRDCRSLSNVVIPDSMVSIGYGAFEECINLTGISIPDSVISIGSRSFNCCKKNTGFDVAENNKFYKSIDGVLFSKDSKTLIQYPCGKPNTSYTITDNTTAIKNWAFYSCTALTSIVIPDSVTSIGSDAFVDTGFYNDPSNWENGVLYVGKHLIDVNTDISGDYSIKDSTLCVADEAFLGCTHITDIIVSGNNTVYKSIDGVLFSKDGKTLIQYPCGKSNVSYIIPNSVTNIKNKAFYSCTNLTHIDIGNNVSSIGYDAFVDTGYYRDSSNWENNVLYIGKHLIDTNTGIQDGYRIKDGTLHIADEAFYNCTKLTDVTIPDSVTTIGNHAFFNCTSLTGAIIPDSVISIGKQAFHNTKIHNNSSNWENGVLYIGKHLIDASISGDYSIKNGTLCITDEAFLKCYELTGVIIPESVTTIGHKAFLNCPSLVRAVISNGETRIGNDAFSGCDKLAIYGDADSSAMAYANKHNIPFGIIGEKLPSWEDVDKERPSLSLKGSPESDSDYTVVYILVGVVVLISAAAVIIVLVIRKKSSKAKDTSENDSNEALTTFMDSDSDK